MDSPSRTRAASVTVVMADGSRLTLDAVSLELPADGGSSLLTIDLTPPAQFESGLSLLVEPAASLRASHFSTLTLRPGACNVLHVAMQTHRTTEVD